MKLVGEANDYVGKGMSGGDVVIVPPAASTFRAEDASLVGNTCLYGATGGRLFVNGRAGGGGEGARACMEPQEGSNLSMAGRVGVGEGTRACMEPQEGGHLSTAGQVCVCGGPWPGLTVVRCGTPPVGLVIYP